MSTTEEHHLLHCSTEFPKLFKAALFKLIEWNHRGINTSHLRFADDIVILAQSLEGLRTTLVDLHSASQWVGLKMNMDKTKIISDVHVTPILVVVEGLPLDVVDEYISVRYG